MSISRQSPLPPPQSPHIALGEDKLKAQLELEQRLLETGEQLIELYKASRQWKQVSQIAQTLNSNCERITCIQDGLSSLNVFELPPPTPPSSSSEQVQSIESLPSHPELDEKMVEDPDNRLVSVKLLDDDEGNGRSWEIRSKLHTNGEPVRRSPKDVSLMLMHICKGSSQPNSWFKNGSIESPDALREILISNLENSFIQDDSVFQSFFSPKINNFSELLDTTQSEIGVAAADCQHSTKETEEPKQDEVFQVDDQPESPSNVQNGNESDEPLPVVEETQSLSPSHKSEDEQPHIDPRSEERVPELKNGNESCNQDETQAPNDQTNTSTEDIVESNIEGTSVKEEDISIDKVTDEETQLQSDKEIKEEMTAPEPTTATTNEEGESSTITTTKEEGEMTEPSTTTTANEEEESSTTTTTTTTTKEEEEMAAQEPSTTSTTTTTTTTANEEEESTTTTCTTSAAATSDGSVLPANETVLEEQREEMPSENNKEKKTNATDTQTDETSPSLKEGDVPVEDKRIEEQGDDKSKEVDKELLNDTQAKEDCNVPVRAGSVSPLKSGIQITSASQMFVKPVDADDDITDTDPTPVVSDTDTPTTDISSSEGILSRSDDHNTWTDTAAVSAGKPPSGRSSSERVSNTPEPKLSEDSSTGKSTFFTSVDHSVERREDSPKNYRRGKAHSVMYSSSSRSSASPPPGPPDHQDQRSKLNKLKRSFKRTNKIKREVSTEGSVSLMAPQLATNWDPTCILEELYSDCRPVAPRSSTGESSRYAGYLDKLPVNQSKPAVMKGWKHRYFRVTRGSLFYYDDEKSQKAISFVRLTDAKIVLHQESLKVEITEKNGNFIFLRAETRDDVVALQRALQLEAVHPTLTHRLSLSPSIATPTIILDLGSCSIRAGLLNDNNYPQLFYPNVCAFNNEVLVACGNDSLLPSTRGVSKLVYPRRHRSRMDSTLSVRECFTAIVEDICKKLDAKPENCNMLASVSPIMPENEQQILAEIVLETLGFQGLLIQEQTTLALYSYNCTTGVSVNIGDSISVVPIVDGYKVEGADQHIHIGGMNVTENLSKLASARDIRYFSDTEMYIVRHIKESLCFVSQEYFEDAEKCDLAPHEYTRAADVDRFQLPDHKKVIALDLALFKAPEGLFQPAIWGKDVPGVHEMIHRGIEQCPIDMRREMCRHIYLSGGTSLMAGLPERLKLELSKLMPRMEFIIHADENRYHAAYLGAAVLASLNTFQKSLVTQDDWISDGFDAFKKSDS